MGRYSVHDSLRIHGRGHKGTAHTEQHHPIPLWVYTCLFLLLRYLLQVADLFHPSHTPVDVTMFVHLDILIHEHRGYSRKSHTRHHREVGVEAKNIVNIEKLAQCTLLTMEEDKDLADSDLRHPDALVVAETEREGCQMKHLPGCNLHLVLRSCACPPWAFSCELCERRYEDLHYR